MNKKKKKIYLIILLVVALGCFLVYSIVSRKGDKPDDDFGDVLYNDLYSFFADVKKGNFTEAYSKLSQKSKDVTFKDETELASYCNYNFLTYSGDVRYISLDNYEKVSSDNYVLYVTVGNEDGDTVLENISEEDLAMGNVKTYKFLINHNKLTNNYTIEFI